MIPFAADLMKSSRACLLVSSVFLSTACGTDVRDDVSQTSSAFSETACAAATADLKVAISFDNVARAPYNNCYRSYVVDVARGNLIVLTPTPGWTLHEDIMVDYNGPQASTRAQCEGLYGAAYFYTYTPTTAPTTVAFGEAYGWWNSAAGRCIPPQINLRDFDRYYQVASTTIRIAATMRAPDRTTLDFRVADYIDDAKMPTGCQGDAAYMLSGERLYTDQFFLSCDGRFRLYMQADGNLVLSQKDAHGNFSIPLWTTHTDGVSQVNALELWSNGDLLVADHNGNAVWDTGTTSSPGVHLKLFNDGNMKLYGSPYGTVWQSKTGGH